MLEKPFYKTMIKESFSMPVKVVFWDESEVTYGDGEPEVTIKFNEKIPLKAITQNASIALGEAYMDKKIEVLGSENSLQKLVFSAYQSADSFLKSSKFSKFLPKQKHTEQQSKSDVQSHYDVGNDFYELWLDKSMTYSCAYFEEGNHDDLHQAQIAKVHHIIKKLDPKPNKTLLDIGCGWGTLMLTAAKDYHLKVMGVTLSQEQFDFVSNKIKADHLEDVASVKLVDYRQLGDITFDYITSVGMFEHVGKENLSLYFKDIAKYLKNDGVALIHGITGQKNGGFNGWINKYIFPGGYVPGMCENLNHIQNAGLQVADLEMLRRHYQRTLEIWDKNFNEHRNEVISMHGERFVRMWDLYLQSCAAAFEAGNIDVMQFLLTKGASGKNLPMTREYMYR